MSQLVCKGHVLSSRKYKYIYEAYKVVSEMSMLFDLFSDFQHTRAYFPYIPSRHSSEPTGNTLSDEDI